MSEVNTTRAAAPEMMQPEAARAYYNLTTRDVSFFSSELEQSLIHNAIGKVAMPVSDDHFKEVLQAFDRCVAEVPHELALTTHDIDSRFGTSAGYVRKELVQQDGKQLDDPKSLFHFNERAWEQWHKALPKPSKLLRDFLDAGDALHHTLLQTSYQALQQLEDTHPNITAAHFPLQAYGHESFSFLRLISYDAYTAQQDMPAVAKAHYDIGHFTLQAYADSPGFWGSKQPGEARHAYPTQHGEAYLFAGQGYQKLYGALRRIEPLYHGVERQAVPAGTTIPKRHAVILFTDAPYIDPGVTPTETLPELYR